MSTKIYAHVRETIYSSGDKDTHISVSVRVNGKQVWDVSTGSVPRKNANAFIKEQIQHFAWENKKIEMPKTYILFETKQVNTDHELSFLGE